MTINKVTMEFVGKDKFGGDVFQTNIWKVADIKLDPAKYKTGAYLTKPK